MDKKGGIKAVSDIQQKEIFLKNYWKAVLEQDEKTLPEFFREDALIRWHNTDEEFTVHEFVRANCEYPGPRPRTTSSRYVIRSWTREFIP